MNVGEMQRKLSSWAEQDKGRKFYGLYSLLYDQTWLRLAHDYVAQNAGSQTAGCDGIIMRLFDENLEENLQHLAEELKTGTFEPHPVRRVYIPKANGRVRPLGIASIKDRIVQESLRMILEPIYEADFSQTSFGFRPNRRTMDAIRCITWSTTEQKRFFWIVEGDLASYFDTIHHRRLIKILRRRLRDERIIQLIWKFLRAGVMEGKLFKDTLQGVPQGGIISPLLANIALHGMETKLVASFKKWSRVKSINGKSYSTPNSPAVIRYADDFVVMHSDLEVILKSEQIVSEWLTGLGLELKPSKTRITHSLTAYEGNVGIDFLGFNLRQYPAGKSKSNKTTGRLSEGTKEYGRSLGFMSRSKPSKEAKKRHYRSLCEAIDRHRASRQKLLIQNLNPMIRGWSNYYFTSTDGFADLDHQLFNRLFEWARRRHPMKNDHWIANKYWHVDKTGKWKFADQGLGLFKHGDVKYRHHIKVRGEKSPYDGDWMYWSTRLGRHPDIKPSVARLLRKQAGRCVWCGLRFKHEEEMEVDHLIAKSAGGSNGYWNLQVLHGHCHDEKHRGIEAGAYDKSRVSEEPCEAKVSRTVLKTSR